MNTVIELLIDPRNAVVIYIGTLVLLAMIRPICPGALPNPSVPAPSEFQMSKLDLVPLLNALAI